MKHLAYLFIALFMITSCSKNPSVVLPKNDGEWNFILTTIVKGSSNSTTTEAGTMNFINGGSGSITIIGFNSVAFTWTATKENVIITFQGNTAFVYNVIEKGTNCQTLERLESSGSVTIEETIKLTRK
jgi:hypothetical protein